MTACFSTSGMSWGLTGIFCSTSLKMAISSPSTVWTLVVRDSTLSFGWGSTAGSGRKRNEASTVPATAKGTVTPHVTINAAERNNRRNMRRMESTASHGSDPKLDSPRIVTFVPSPERPPSVDALARSLAGTGLPHPLLVEVAREAIAAGDPDSALARADVVGRALLQPVINATGVLLHTNLGRAPIGYAQEPRYT